MAGLPKPGEFQEGYIYKGGAPNDPQSWTPVQGEQLFKYIPQDQAAQVKALVEGRTPFTSMSARSPYMLKIAKYASLYDPEFDLTNFPARSKTRSSYSAGPDAKNITALNTALGHLGTLASQVDSTAGHDMQAVNGIINYFNEQTGDPGITTYKGTQDAVAHEIRRVFAGTGQGSQQDLDAQLANLSPNFSREQKMAAIRNVADLLRSRIDALKDTWTRGMGKGSGGVEFISPKAKHVLDMIDSYNPETNPNPFAQKAPAQRQQAQPKQPKVIDWKDLP